MPNTVSSCGHHALLQLDVAYRTSRSMPVISASCSMPPTVPLRAGHEAEMTGTGGPLLPPPAYHIYFLFPPPGNMRY